MPTPGAKTASGGKAGAKASSSGNKDAADKGKQGKSRYWTDEEHQRFLDAVQVNHHPSLPQSPRPRPHPRPSVTLVLRACLVPLPLYRNFRFLAININIHVCVFPPIRKP